MLVERPFEWWAKRVDADDDEGCVTAGRPDALQDLGRWVSMVAEIEGAEITHVLVSPVMLAAALAFRPAIGWKPRSIRAARRNRGRMIRAMRTAEAKGQRRA